MLVYAGITPHTPLLIPTIGKENLAQLKQTVRSLEMMKKTLTEARPDTIIIISGHHSFLTDHFIINLHPEYKGDFQEFSDLTTELFFKADVTLVNHIRDVVEDKVPLTLKSEENLEYGVLAPLYYLASGLSEMKIVPVSYALLDNKTHFRFGEFLEDVIHDSSKRIAVIASGDMSHTLTKDAPGGYSKKAKQYDQSLIKMLKEKDVESILNIEDALLEEVRECSLRSIVTLLGILKNVSYRPEILSYEHPFGVGYLTAQFRV